MIPVGFMVSRPRRIGAREATGGPQYNRLLGGIAHVVAGPRTRQRTVGGVQAVLGAGKSHKRGLGPKTPPLPNYSNLPSKNAKKKPPTDPCSSRARDQREVLDGDNKPLDFSGSCIFLMTSVKI